MAMEPQIAASRLLESVWGDRPFPVDPIWIARQLGIDVIEADLPGDVSGAIIKDKGKDPLIALSSSDSKNRKRFSCAHEIGHYAYRMSNGEEHYEYVDLRDRNAQSGTDPEEIYANQFAAELLMPQDEVRRLHKQKLPAFLMAQHFGVSDDAMRFRLMNLGCRA